MAKYAAALDQGTTSTALHDLRPRRQGGQRSPRRSTSRSSPSRAGSSTTRRRSGTRTQEVIDEAMRVRGRIGRRHRRAWASPTSARRRSSGTGTPASRCTTRSSGRTRAPTSSVDELSKDGGQDRFREQTGLPIATYFSGPKVRWILDNVDGARATAEAGDLLFGNMDTWCIWNLTGGTDGGLHVTDVTNASRTLLMDLETLDWDEGCLGPIGVPTAMLPEIRASSEVYGEVELGRRFRASRSPATSATSRRRRSARPASRPARPRTPTAPATSCCSTRAPRPCSPSPG